MQRIDSHIRAALRIPRVGNFGRWYQTLRSSADASTVAHLLPVIDAQGGPVPAMRGWYIDFMFPIGGSGERLDGGAFFQIADEPGLSKRPIVMAVARGAKTPPRRPGNRRKPATPRYATCWNR